MTGECQQTLIGHSSWVSCVSVTKDCKTIISGSNDKNVKLWNAMGNEHAEKLSTPSDHIIHHATQPECVAITADGRWGLSGSKNDSLKLWDIKNAKYVSSHAASIACIASMHKSTRVVTGSHSGDLTLWNCDGSLEVEQNVKVHQGSIASLKISKDDMFILSASSDKTIGLFHVVSGHEEQLLGHSDAVLCLDFLKGELRAISGSKDKTLRLWNLQKQSCEQIFSGHTGDVGCLASTDDNTIVVSGSGDHTICVWSTDSGECLHTIEGHHDSIKCLGITSDNRFAIAGSHEGKDQLLMWDLSNGNCVRKFIGHTHAVMNLQLLSRASRDTALGPCVEDIHVLMTSSRDGTIKVWDMASGKLVTSFDFQSQVKYFDAHSADDGYSVILVTKSGTVSVLKLFYSERETKNDQGVPLVTSNFQISEDSSSAKEAPPESSCPCCQFQCQCQCKKCTVL